MCTFFPIILLAFQVNALDTLEVTQEAEIDYSYAGPGTASIKYRGSASNEKTLLVINVGGEVSWDITIPATGDYSLVVRYSNDDTGVLDDVSVRVNGILKGSFESMNTYVPGTPWGSGWDEFTNSPVISLGQLAAGTVTLSLRLDADDGYGIEYDLLTLTGTNIQPPPAPQHVSPVNGASNISTSPSLNWIPVPGINTYHIQVDDNADFSSPEADIAGLTGTEYPIGGLDEGTAYYWRVRASNVCKDGPWSSPWMFTIECLVSASITPNGSTTICEGESVFLTATGGADFLWSNGATTATVMVETSGTYSVTVNNSVNCTAVDSIEIMAQPVLTPSISIEVDNQTICGGSPVTFEANTTNEGDEPVFEWLVNGNQAGSDSSVFITNALQDGDVVQCRLFSSEGCTSINPVVSNAITVSKTLAYYHPLQNFDFYVDRVKSFYNFFGGNSGIVNADLLEIAYDTSETRTGYGRSLKITYQDMEGFSIYVESLERKWFDPSTWLNLKDLFPDFVNPALQSRQIDSIVFYGKLVANQPLTLQVKLEDANKQGATMNRVVQPTSQWQRFAFALDDFSGNFDPGIAKFVGLNFDQGLGQNDGTSGIFYLDDIYLVENCFEKPTFSSPEAMMAYLNEVSFRYFWMAVEPKSKFALDRHVWDDLISTDAIGFSLSAYVIAHKNGWIDSTLVEERVEHILTYLLDSCSHATDTNMVINDPLGYASVNGIWAHFLDHKTLARKDDRTEFSIFSTALLLAGVITAAEYFDWNPTIIAKADALYRLADWNFLLRPDGLMNYDWKPETGFSPYFTDWFSEELDLAFLLGISSPEPAHRLPFNPYFLVGYRKPLCLDGDYIYSAPGSNFTYYFLQMYARFDAQSQRFTNTKNALLGDLDFCQNNYDILGYNPLIFGTTACEGPDSAGIDFIMGADTFFISNYHAYGYCCKFDRHNTGNGTVALYGSGSAALFLPQEVKDLWSYYYNDLDEEFWNEYGYRFWSPIFGMPDAFHLAPDNTWDTLVNSLRFRGPWLSAPRFGIDVGPMLMNMDSYLSETTGAPSVRDYFSQYPPIASNLPQFENLEPTDELKPGIALSLVSDQTICEGDSLVFEVSLQHGGDMPFLEWYLDGALEQTGSDTVFAVMASPGTHQVFCNLTSSEHCIEGQVATSDILSANVLPANPVSLSIATSADTICSGDEVTFTAIPTNGGAMPDYQWSLNGTPVGGNTDTLTISIASPSDVVSCQLTSSEDCVSGNPAIVEVSIPMVFDLPGDPHVSNDGPACEGGAILLTADAIGAETYKWMGPNNFTSDSPMVTLDDVTLTDTGTYSVLITTAQGCSTVLQTDVMVFPIPDVSVSACFPDTLLTTTPPIPLANCGAPPGGEFLCGMEPCTEFDPMLAGVGEHTITYQYTDPNGCMGIDSIMIVVEMANAVTTTSQNLTLNIFPNPSNGTFIIQSNRAFGQAKLTVVNSLGQQVWSESWDTATEKEKRLHLMHLPAGVYWIAVVQGERQIGEKVVVR